METSLSYWQSLALENLLCDIGIGIVAVALDGTVLFSNKCASDLLPVKTGQIALGDWPRRYGLYLLDGTTSCPPEQSPPYRAIHGEEADDVELFVSPPDGSSPGKWCGFNIRPMRDGDNKITGALMIIQDVTKRVQLAKEVARSNMALQQFASVAAHDLQEPLRSVTGFVDLLSEETTNQLDENCVHYMTRIKVSVQRMRQLIGDLLAFSRIQTTPHINKPVDCREIVDSCIDNLSALIDASGAQIIVQELPVIVADGPQLCQVFQNLLSNSLKFISKDTPPIVEIAAQKQNNKWVFSVKDNGIGMDMQFADRIFIAFQRLHGRNSYSGTGIGLAICKGIVERHGGNIWIESGPGEGTTFYFSLPAHTLRERTL